MRIVSLFISILAAFGTCSCSSGTKAAPPENTILYTTDGVVLGATVYRPAAAERPPGLVLIHRYGGNRSVWEGFARNAQQAGMLVVAIDLRGHGDSTGGEGKPLHYSRLSEAELLNSLLDLETATKFVRDNGAHPENLALMGEGLGANLALRYTLQSPDIQAVVMISPGLEYNGVETEDAIRRLKDCPALLVASEGDAYSALSAAALKQAAPVFAELRTWPGSSHGADIFATHAESMQYILHWLGNILSAKDASPS